MRSTLNNQLLISFFKGAFELAYQNLSWLYQWIVLAIVIICVILTFSKVGNIRIGGPDAKPKYGFWSWFAMSLTGGIGASIVSSSISQPITFLQSIWGELDGYGIEPGSSEAVLFALGRSFHEWSVFPYAFYGICSISIADLIDHDETQKVKVEYRQRYRTIVVEYTNRSGERELHPMYEMSDGYRSVLSMVADIAHRMAVLNPQLDDAILETPGVIIIDEVELHLHPGWQKRILKDLTSVFPNIQFIVSTHSPEVITSYKEANLILLKHEGSASQIESAYGKDVNTVLRSILLVGDRPAEIKELFDKFSQVLDAEDYPKARKILSQLENILGYDDPEVYKARSSLEIEQMEWPE